MKPLRRRSHAFTLLELMIVVTIIALLAEISLPSFMRARQRARMLRFCGDTRAIASAFEQYRIEHDDWPADTSPGQVPAGMKPYLGRFDMTQTTAIGGKWDWFRGGRQAAVAISGVTVPQDQMGGVDEMMDDGILFTGLFRILSGTTYAYFTEM
jgi:prepilin-type N-terminal cleavage/methylation domain-containing protein